MVACSICTIEKSSSFNDVSMIKNRCDGEMSIVLSCHSQQMLLQIVTKSTHGQKSRSTSIFAISKRFEVTLSGIEPLTGGRTRKADTGIGYGTLSGTAHYQLRVRKKRAGT